MQEEEQLMEEKKKKKDDKKKKEAAQKKVVYDKLYVKWFKQTKRKFYLVFKAFGLMF